VSEQAHSSNESHRADRVDLAVEMSYGGYLEWLARQPNVTYKPAGRETFESVRRYLEE
jgi:hypothetical protein